LTAAAGAHEFHSGDLVIAHPWSRPTAPGMPMGVAYLSITNNGKAEDTLIAASSPAAARVEMHETTISDGMARMRPLRQIVIGPGQSVQIAPGGIHLMLVDLKAPLALGASVPLTLIFRVAGKVEVTLDVEARA
jgi:copper(I)-binding protein